MSAPTPPIFYVRRAHKAEKLVLDLGVARSKQLIAYDVVAVTVLDKGTGTFTLTWHFYDGTEFSLDNTEILNGDVFEWDVAKLYLTNTEQSGATLKLIVDIQRQ
jgi:3-mercaptopyruvate sulfurtransferase SseA